MTDPVPADPVPADPVPADAAPADAEPSSGTASAVGAVPRRAPGLAQAALLRAAAGQPVAHTPVWFMRQAGRSLPEYRAIRGGVGMLESCTRPELVTEITLQPVRRHRVDAAILFSDIVVPLAAIGVDVQIVSGVGPVIGSPVRTAADLDRLRPLDPGDVEYVTAAVSELVGQLGATPLIGFAGAPFTLASYLVEGGPSRDHARTKALMYGDPDLWSALLARLARIATEFLRVQLRAGASAVQLFDSWAGALSAADYARCVLPHTATVLRALAGTVPRIHFGVHSGELLTLMSGADVDVLGVDGACVMTRAGEDEALRLRAVAGQTPPVGSVFAISPQGPAGLAVLSGAPVFIGDGRPRGPGTGETDTDDLPFTASWRADGVRSAVFVPLGKPGHTYGVIAVLSKTSRDFTGNDLRFVQELAALLAVDADRRRIEALVRH